MSATPGGGRARRTQRCPRFPIRPSASACKTRTHTTDEHDECQGVGVAHHLPGTGAEGGPSAREHGPSSSPRLALQWTWREGLLCWSPGLASRSPFGGKSHAQ
jgi:hypothetical protein